MNEPIILKFELTRKQMISANDRLHFQQKGKITLDMQANQVYKDNLPAWDKVVRSPQFQMPYLDYGRNLISWDGNFGVFMIPNWGVKL